MTRYDDTTPATGFTLVHNGRVYGYGVTGPKWACDTCHRSGYGHPDSDRGHAPHWTDSCRRGHAPCGWCGKQLSLRLDGTPRVHSRCPERPDHAERVRDIAAEVAHDARLTVRGPATRSAVIDHLTTPESP